MTEPSPWIWEKVPRDTHEYAINLVHPVKFAQLETFPYARFNIPFRVLRPTPAEFSAHFRSRLWSAPETARLLDAVEDCEGCFPAVADRLAEGPVDLDAIKERFFEVQETLLVVRWPVPEHRDELRAVAALYSRSPPASLVEKPRPLFYDGKKERVRRAQLAKAYDLSLDEEKRLGALASRLARVDKLILEKRQEKDRAAKRAEAEVDKYVRLAPDDELVHTLEAVDFQRRDICTGDLELRRGSHCVYWKVFEPGLIAPERMLSPVGLFRARDGDGEKNVFLRSELLLRSFRIPVLGTFVEFPLEPASNLDTLGRLLSERFREELEKRLGKDKFFVNTEIVQLFYEKFCVDLAMLVAMEYKCMDQTMTN